MIDYDGIVKALTCNDREHSCVCHDHKCLYYLKDGPACMANARKDDLYRDAADAIIALTAKLEQAEADLKCAVGDMESIASAIANSNEFLFGGVEKVKALDLGRCNVCKKVCRDDKPCCFEWKGAKQC